MKAALYARVSTDKQSESSVQEQLRRCRQYADMKGWEVVDEFTDVGSGMNTEREGFQSLMEADWDVVIAYKLDRFHRSATNAQLWAKHLDSVGRNFVAIDYDIDTTSIHGRLIYTILTALAEMEVELTKERTRMGLQAVKNEGRWVGKLLTATILCMLKARMKRIKDFCVSTQPNPRSFQWYLSYTTKENR